jgi:hypothetical protein
MSVPSARRVFAPAPRVAAAVLTGALAMCLAVTGCASEEPAKTAPTPAPTPISGLNTAAMRVPRIEFCSAVPDEAVADALGGKPDTKTAYGNGDKEKLAGAGEDVLHEIGCSWSTDEGSAARAWVFARPVDALFAKRVIASTAEPPGCRVASEPAFGRPTVTQVCRRAGGDQRVRHAGLFGQTWLSCEVSAPAADATGIRDRADEWCVQVANALNTAR